MSSSELHLLYVLGTISLMLGLTERPVIAPYPIAIEDTNQHIPVLGLPMDAPILAGFQRPCQGLHPYGIWIGSVVGSTTKTPLRPSASMARKTTCPASLMAGPSVEERPENRSKVPLSRGESPVRARAVRSDTPALPDMSQEQT